MSIEAMKLALDALEYCIPSGYGPTEIREDAITALRAAIELAEKQEPMMDEKTVVECIRYFNEDYKRDFDVKWREDLTKGIKQHFGIKL